MRKVRPVILLAILAIVAGVAVTYYTRLKLQAGSALSKPKALAPGTLATSHAWTYKQTTNRKTAITVSAEDLQEIEGKQQLTGVQLDIFHKDGNEYDHVKCAKAEFDMNQGDALFRRRCRNHHGGVGRQASQRPVDRHQIFGGSGREQDGQGAYRPVWRLFNSTAAKAKAVGADYDPNTRELVMHSQVDLTWRGSDPKTVPMKIDRGRGHI